MSFILDLVIPGAGVVLSSILDLCSEVTEGQEECKKLYDRLKTIFNELSKMEEHGQLPSSEPVDKYKKVLAEYLLYLQHYREQKLVNRLIDHRTMVDELAPIYEEIDNLFRMLNLATTASMMEWKHEWKADRQVSQEMMVAILLILRLYSRSFRDRDNEMRCCSHSRVVLSRMIKYLTVRY